MAKDRDKPYHKAFVAAAPFAFAQALTEIPKGTADKMVEDLVSKKKTRFGQSFTGALKGRASGRAIGRLGIGALTAPIFLSGVKDLQSSDPADKRRGMAKVVGVAGIYGGSKGVVEAVVEGRKMRTSALKGLVRGKGLGRAGTAILMAVPAAVAAAKGIKASRKAKARGETSYKKYLYPGAVGGAAGALKSLPESTIRHGMPKSLSTLRKLHLGPMAGRAAAGVIGGVALGALVDKFQDSMKKRSADESAVDSGMQIPGMTSGFRLYGHQAHAIEKLIQNDGKLVMAHGTGSGKSATSIAAHNVLKSLGRGDTSLVIVPTGLRGNFAGQLKRFSPSSTFEIIGTAQEKTSTPVDKIKGGKDMYIIGYALFRRHPEIADIVKPDTLIVDEYHTVRNPAGATYDAIMDARAGVKNFIGLTGSVVNNDPADVAPLVALASGEQFMTKRQFKNRFERRVARVKGFFGGSKYVVGMQNIPQMQKELAPYVDYVSTEDIAVGKMPKKDVQTVEVSMSSDQEKYYKYILGQLNPITAWQIRHNVSVSDSEVNNVFSQIIRARQVSNSLHTIDKKVTPTQSSYLTPKAKKLLDDTVNHLKTTPDGQVVIYSNLVHGGADVVAAGLRNRKIPYGVFIGKGRDLGNLKVTEESRNKAVADFQAGKSKVILLSGAGAEGLDLKNTTMVQMFDGHFNPERILQAEARGRRIGGLMHRKPENRRVQVKRYVSTIEKDIWDKIFGKGETSVDQWVYSTAGRKAKLNTQFFEAMKSTPKQEKTRLNTILKGIQHFNPKPTGATVQKPIGRVTPATKIQKSVQHPVGRLAPATRTPKGVELPKDFTKKYIRRWRQPSGEITYEYPEGL